MLLLPLIQVSPCIVLLVTLLPVSNGVGLDPLLWNVTFLTCLSVYGCVLHVSAWWPRLGLAEIQEPLILH